MWNETKILQMISIFYQIDENNKARRNQTIKFQTRWTVGIMTPIEWNQPLNVEERPERKKKRREAIDQHSMKWTSEQWET